MLSSAAGSSTVGRMTSQSGESGIASGLPPSTAILFVGNISVQADAAYMIRLFSAYGRVIDCSLASGNQYALVTYQSTDDADCAIAALHLRYCMSAKVPLLVMYSNTSPQVSEYGASVSLEYRSAVARGSDPVPVALTRFDPSLPRGAVELPPSEIAPPPMMHSRRGNHGAFTLQQSSFPPGQFP